MTYLIIVDLEATCDVNDKINRSAMEIIEFGAAKIDVGSFNILDSYQGYIKPVVNPVLTPFCKNLTGISQNEVDDAPYFYEALNLFSMWMFESGSINAWASWGATIKVN